MQVMLSLLPLRKYSITYAVDGLYAWYDPGRVSLRVKPAFVSFFAALVVVIVVIGVGIVVGIALGNRDKLGNAERDEKIILHLFLRIPRNPLFH